MLVKAVRKNIIISLFACNLSSCIPVQETASTKSVESSNQISQCLAPQGNGGNWAATIGWMSEQLQYRINTISTPRNDTTVFLNCITGGSSGAVSTALVMTILSNQNLFGQDMTGKNLTIEQTQILADSLKFIAYSLDLSFSQLASFVTDYIKAMVGSSINNTDVMKSIARNVFGDKSAKWWGGEVVDPNTLIVDYATVLLLAKELKKEDVYEKVSNHFNTKDTAFLTSLGIEKLIDMDEYSRFVDLPDNGEKTRQSDLYMKRSEKIGEIAFRRIRSQFKTFSYINRYGTGAKKESPETPLKKIMEMPLKHGFCGIVMGALYGTYSEIDLDKAPDYSALRPIVICSKDTIETIIGSSIYQNHILTNHPFASRFVFMESKNVRSMILTSIREPGLMAELAGNINEGDMEFKSIYDPSEDFKTNNSYTFKLRPSNLASNENVSSRPKTFMAVAGGFPDRRISAWVNSYLFLEHLTNSKKENFGAFYSIFGKPDTRFVDKFDTSSIRTTFSSNPKDGQKNVEDWFRFQDSWCSTFAPLFAKKSAKIETVAFNWDVTSIPAAQSRKSHFLISKAVNATRLQLTSYSHTPETPQKLVYDPNKNILPVPTVGFNCAP
jgi:hypothetical protein